MTESFPLVTDTDSDTYAQTSEVTASLPTSYADDYRIQQSDVERLQKRLEALRKVLLEDRATAVDDCRVLHEHSKQLRKAAKGTNYAPSVNIVNDILRTILEGLEAQAKLKRFGNTTMHVKAG